MHGKKNELRLCVRNKIAMSTLHPIAGPHQTTEALQPSQPISRKTESSRRSSLTLWKYQRYVSQIKAGLVFNCITLVTHWEEPCTPYTAGHRGLQAHQQGTNICSLLMS